MFRPDHSDHFDAGVVLFLLVTDCLECRVK